MQLGALGFLVIGLEREAARRERLQSLLAQLGVVDVEWIAAVDGEELAARQGRARKVKPGRLRLCYNDDDGGRTCTTLRLPRRSATLNPWSILGCSLSHALALERVKDRFLAGHTQPLVVLEDDAALIGDAEQTAAVFAATMAGLQAAVPDWTFVHLGGKRVDSYAHRTRNKPSTVENLGVSEQIYQTHAYMLAPASAAAALDHIVQKLRAGFPSDAAVVSWTSRNFDQCFYFRPFLFCQAAGRSSIAVARQSPSEPAGPHGNGRLAQTARRLLGVAARAAFRTSGLPSIHASALKALRRQSGGAGGRKKAGSTSTAADVKKKEAWLRRQRSLTGSWPSSHAAKQRGISFRIWKRVAADDA